MQTITVEQTQEWAKEQQKILDGLFSIKNDLNNYNDIKQAAVTPLHIWVENK